jgi:signal transduction histidine kinase/ligand-binding sensor domain-containing protein
LLLDRENALWVGTSDQGIYRVYDGGVDRFRNADGLSSDSVNGFYEDREGNLWVASSGGIDCFRDTRVVSFSAREGLSANQVGAVLASRNGTIWVGNDGALDFIRDRSVSSIREGKGLPGHRVTSLLEDHAGHLWVGIDDGLFVYEEQKFRAVRRRDGTPIGAVIAMIEDRDHNIWAETIGNPARLVRIQDFEIREELPAPQLPAAAALAADPQDGIWLGLVNGNLARYRSGQLDIIPVTHGQPSTMRQLLVNSDGSVLGATSAGLIAWRKGTLSTLTVHDGLPCESLYGLVSYAEGALWIYAQCGLVKISSTDLQEWWIHPDHAVNAQVLDVFDGAQPSGGPFQPRASRSPDGRLWFANENGLQMINPAQLASNPIPPPVHVEEIVADRKSYSPRQGVHLPSLTRDLEIEYTALSFVTPQRVRFRYKLEGHDAGWQEPGTRHQAFYSDLRPGQYRFRVIACNNDGVWNNEGATLDFSLAPAWYQTIWFRVSCVGGFVLLLWALYQLRLQQLQQQFNMMVEARVGERTRIARELHDTLLQSLHGLMFRFQAARNMLPGRAEQAMQALDGAIARTEQAIAESRGAIRDLRSEQLAQSDLAELLTSMGQELMAFEDANRDGPVFRVIVEGERRRLSPILHEEVYWIARELLRNALQHASAHRIEAEIRYEDHLFRLRIRDDGKGMDPKVLEAGGRAGHWGLPGVRERAQKLGVRLDFWSEAGAGTEVQLTVPAAVAYEKSGDSAGLFRKAGIHGRQS